MKKLVLSLATAMFMATFNLNAQVAPTIVAAGLSNGLVGIEVDASGNIWVTETGTGNDDGTVSIISPDGSITPFMTGLPSTTNPFTGETAGPARTIQMPNNKLLIIVGEGQHPQAEAVLVVDKANFLPGTPLTVANVEQTIKIGDFVHAQGMVKSNPYNLTWDADGNMLIVDAGANAILKRNQATGELSIVAILSPFPNPLPFGPPFVGPVPTDIVPNAQGEGYYVSQLTGFPFLDGAANIFHLNDGGSLAPWQTGFTLLTDLGYDPKDGQLVAMQFGRFGPVDSTMGFIPGSSAAIKVHQDGTRDTIAAGIIGLAPSFAFDAGGDLYVADLFGFVYKYDFVSGTGDRSSLKTSVKTYPNPFSAQVNIGFELEKAATIQANIYDLNGRLLHAFAEQKMAAGQQVLTWDSRGAEPGLKIYHLLVEGRLTSGLLQLVR